MKESFCIFLCLLQFTDGCYVSGELKEVTAYTGGSVLLPCSCSDPQSTVNTFTWIRIYEGENHWPEVFQDGQYKNRLKLFNQSSPANLSLLISDLRKKDEGHYRCKTSQSYIDVRVQIKGCDLEQNKQEADVTGRSGESVVLPCSCTELQAKPEQLTWTFTPLNKHSEEIYPHEQSERHIARVKLLNKTSPGNLSLQISNLNNEDQGEYRCSVSSQHVNIRLTVKEEPITKQPEDKGKLLFILLPVLLVVLLLAVLALIYWKYRATQTHKYSTCDGRRNVQKTNNDGLVLFSENEKQGDVNPGSVTQGENFKQDENMDEVTYSSVVHIKTDSKPAHVQTVMTEHSEYASIR